MRIRPYTLIYVITSYHARFHLPPLTLFEIHAPSFYQKNNARTARIPATHPKILAYIGRYISSSTCISSPSKAADWGWGRAEYWGRLPS